MGKRRDRFDQRLADQKASKGRNAPRKVAERQRREARMKAILKAGKLPYTRPVRNWLAVQLGKNESQLTQADVDKLLGPAGNSKSETRNPKKARSTKSETKKP